MAKKPSANAVNDGYQLSLKVSEKGAVSLYGLRRFPATYYADEWEAMLARADSIRAFIAAHEDDLKRKGHDEEEGGDRTAI